MRALLPLREGIHDRANSVLLLPCSCAYSNFSKELEGIQSKPGVSGN